MEPSAITTTAWDVIIIGAGHNGLTCAAYLARAGKRVLVLEARARIGGACTIEEPWPGCRVSPCAYLCGLLHPIVIEELDLVRRGFAWTPAAPGLFVPFEDGFSLQLWEDADQCETEIRRVAPEDLAGWRAMQDLITRTRDALRPPDDNDLWLNPEPTRDDIEERLGGDEEARALLFHWSMADYLDRYLTSERLKEALYGQGVIGTHASPLDPGTASIHFHHSSGRMFGQPGTWGFVKGGMGHLSFLLQDIAEAHGATVCCVAPVARILPGEGVELAGGDRIHAPVIVANADPQTTLGLLADQADPAWRAQVEAIPTTSSTMKATLKMNALPDFLARPGTNEIHHQGQINTPLSRDAWRANFEAADAGRLPDRLWTELYLQTATDPTMAPPGIHLVSVFAQCVPYTFREGTWDQRRDEVGRLILDTLGRFCSNIPEAVIDMKIMGPPDIERDVGLHGGHIFQGSCLPDWMWDRRLTARTPMPGIYLCGAGTHPGGSVIAVNGRNAARAVLTDAHRVRPDGPT